jgi:hypothetical protein
MSDVTRFLSQIESGDPSAAERSDAERFLGDSLAHKIGPARALEQLVC